MAYNDIAKWFNSTSEDETGDVNHVEAAKKFGDTLHATHEEEYIALDDVDLQVARNRAKNVKDLSPDSFLSPFLQSPARRPRSYSLICNLQP